MTPPFTTAAQSKTAPTEAPASAMSITITDNGPFLVKGGVPLTEQAITPVGGHLEYRVVRTYPLQETYALCRCGHTTTPPFCDGSHTRVGFDGTETASRAPFEERADIYSGAGVTLFDDNRCAFARFCHREDGDVWTLTEYSGDEKLKREAIKAASDCPAGRLVEVDTETGAAYEPPLAASIAVLEDSERGVSGPLFVQGGIQLIGADGSTYELRNRYALCRCGNSHTKPFCDAMHVSTGYRDELYKFNEQ